MTIVTYRVFLLVDGFVGGCGVSGRGRVSGLFVDRSGTVEIGSGDSNDGEDNNGDLFNKKSFNFHRIEI